MQVRAELSQMEYLTVPRLDISLAKNTGTNTSFFCQNFRDINFRGVQ